MPFSDSIQERVRIEAARHCCVCHRYRGVKVEVHHIIPEAQSNDNSYENAICLCFDCHADAGHYNPQHPKGSKFSPRELRKSRDAWKQIVKENKIEVAGEEWNRLHVQYYVCMNVQIAKQISEGNLSGFPVQNSMLWQNEVLNYHRTLLSRLVSFGRDFKVYTSEQAYLEQNPEAGGRSEEYPWFTYNRPFVTAKDSPLLKPEEISLFDFLTGSGLETNDFVRLCASHPGECGGDDETPERIEEYLQIKKPYFMYAVITNLHSEAIQPMELFVRDGRGDTTPTEFPPIRLQPEHSLIVPMGQFLEHKLENREFIEYGDNPSPEKSLVYHRNQGRTDLTFFGTSFTLDSFTYKFGNSFCQFRPHEFNRQTVFYLDEAWFIGSCPHCFIKVDGGTWTYRGELLSAGENKTDTSEVIIEFDKTEMLIAELEDEITFIKRIEDGDKVRFNDVTLQKGEFIHLENLNKGSIVRITGNYHPKGTTRRDIDALFKRNEVVATYLQNINAHCVVD